MEEHKAIYEACNALLKVIPEAHLLTYQMPYLVNQDTLITHINAGGLVRPIHPNGGTPTGRAMIIAAMKYPNSLLIHFTDGMANEDIDPIEAMTHIIAKRQPKVQIANIILYNKQSRYNRIGTPNTQPLEELQEYWTPQGPNWTSEIITDLDEFPDALRRALRPWYQT